MSQFSRHPCFLVTRKRLMKCSLHQALEENDVAECESGCHTSFHSTFWLRSGR